MHGLYRLVLVVALIWGNSSCASAIIGKIAKADFALPALVKGKGYIEELSWNENRLNSINNALEKDNNYNKTPPTQKLEEEQQKAKIALEYIQHKWETHSSTLFGYLCFAGLGCYVNTPLREWVRNYNLSKPQVLNTLDYLYENKIIIAGAIQPLQKKIKANGFPVLQNSILAKLCTFPIFLMVSGLLATGYAHAPVAQLFNVTYNPVSSFLYPLTGITAPIPALMVGNILINILISKYFPALRTSIQGLMAVSSLVGLTLAISQRENSDVGLSATAAGAAILACTALQWSVKKIEPYLIDGDPMWNKMTQQLSLEPAIRKKQLQWASCKEFGIPLLFFVVCFCILPHYLPECSTLTTS